MFMKSLFGLLLSLPTALFAHPGGGIIALSENSAIIADSVENFVWLVEKGEDPKTAGFEIPWTLAHPWPGRKHLR
jgi:hypothetical protein